MFDDKNQTKCMTFTNMNAASSISDRGKLKYIHSDPFKICIVSAADYNYTLCFKKKFIPRTFMITL